MASYPTSAKTFTNLNQASKMDDTGLEGDVVINAIQDEVSAIETDLVSARTITEATTPAATPSSLGEFFDMVATQLKNISGGAHWYSAIGTSLAGLVTSAASTASSLSSHISATVVHGISGNVVGTTDSQTLTNKTLTSPIISTISNTGTVTLPTATDTLVGKATTDTLTNKRITARVQSVSDAATITPDADANDCVDITAIAQAFTIANPTGTPTNFQKLIIRIKDNGTARAITFGSAYVAGGSALPTTTILSKILTLGFIYNTANSLNKWQLVAASQEA